MRVFPILLFTILPWISSAAQNVQVAWSSRSYGPDGPWPAVTVRVGGRYDDRDPTIQATTLDFFPGGRYASYVMTPALCGRWPGTACSAGGLWTPFQDETSTSIAVRSTLNGHAARYLLEGSHYQQSTVISRGPGGAVYNSSLVALEAGNITYPNGILGPPVLSLLSTGWNRNTNLSFSLGDYLSDGSISSFTLPGGLWANKIIPSYTYGLHIGSVALQYSGSLIFRGFDTGRIIGDYVTYSLDVAGSEDNTRQAGPRLLDVVLGVEEGGSPFDNFTEQSKLLLDETSKQGNHHPGGTEVQIDPTDAYIHLSPQTCAKIASYLPIRFDQAMGYYLWRTNDPAFSRIMRSPAYLGFVFSSGGAKSATITIKVPFVLLNLTLSSPIAQQSTAYFPCVPHTLDTKPGNGDSYALGRSFLQAAYTGANWNRGIGWLGQAPGPGNARQGLGPGARDLQDIDTSLAGVATDPALFARSWQNIWTPLPVSEPTATPTSAPTSSTPVPSGPST